MPTFSYRAYGGRGEFAEGRIDAASPDAANEMLWAQGLTPFQMQTADAGAERWWQREVFGGGRSSPAQIASFTRDFATLNSAEIPLDDALRILVAQAPSRAMRTVISSLLADVLDVGLRSSYVASWYAAPLMVERKNGLIAARQLPALGRGAAAPPLGGQQSRQVADQSRGDVEHGTIGNHVESCG